jgi:hypothetical protein
MGAAIPGGGIMAKLANKFARSSLVFIIAIVFDQAGTIHNCGSHPRPRLDGRSIVDGKEASIALDVAKTQQLITNTAQAKYWLDWFASQTEPAVALPPSAGESYR